MLELPYFLTAAVAISAIAAWYDFRTGHIPNWVTLGPLMVAPLAHFAVHAVAGPWQEALKATGYSILGAAACGFVPLLLFRAGAMGGGDVKLLAAIGAILRAKIGIEATLYAFVAAALFAPARMAYEGRLLSVLGNSFAMLLNPFLPRERRRKVEPEMMTSLRFGPAIFVGVCAAAVVFWRPE